jgi:hypothetical protein
MALIPLSEKFDLAPSQFAILFETDRGIEADDLGNFLKRVATIARREGAELRVVRFEPGSLATIFEAVKKSKVAKNAKKEFVKAPIGSSAAITAVVAAVAGALVWAFDAEEAGATALSRAGACVIEEKEVREIKLVTFEQTVVLMNENTARRVREIDNQRKKHEHIEYDQIQMLTDRASAGTLEGGVVSIYGELHFRPDGYKFFVPINISRTRPDVEIYSDAHFRVTGEIVMRNGRPDTIIIQSAKQV